MLFGIESILLQTIPFTLVLSRVVGLLSFAPLLSMAGVPMRVRAILGFILALSLFPLVQRHTPAPPTLDIWLILPLMLAEVLVGATLGMLASVPMLAMEMGGHMVGHQMGLSLASAFNPAFDSEIDVAGQALFTIAAAAFLSLGGIEVLFLALARTFESLPAGEFVSAPLALETYLALASSGLELALRVAAPVIAVLLLILIAMGFVMKTMPQINVLSVGFTVKILAGLLVLAWTVFVIQDVMSDELLAMFETIIRWADNPRPIEELPHGR